jgi:small-conductance mechanosensitive channel
VFYVQQPDFNSYMDTQQAINLAIFKRFEEEGIEFAYPTQTLFVDRVQLPEEFAGTNGEGRGDGGRAAQERDRTAGAARGDRS